jgi:hypothetical protein
MKRRTLIGLGLGLAAAPSFAVARTRRPWRTILDGRSLDGWTAIGDAKWTALDGSVQSVGDQAGFLVSTAAYGDHAIRAEFWVSEDANSGIYIRCANRAEVTPKNSYEVNIFDRRPDQTYATGAIVDIAPVSPVPKAGGRWSVMEIEAEGDRLRVAVNGTVTVANARDATHSRGPIALQHASGLVKFRKVQVREL